MSGNKIPFGEKDGLLFQADEVDNGLGCRCLCPECKRPLVAANEGTKVLPYFRHSQSACSNGFAAGVRRRAVELLLAELQVMLPAFQEVVSGKALDGEVIARTAAFGATLLVADRGEAKVAFGDLTADVVLHAGPHKLLISIRVAKRHDYLKVAKLAGLGLSGLQIDLSTLELNTVLDREAFRHAVLLDLGKRTWLHTERGTRLVERMREEVQVAVDRRNELEREQRKRLIEAERIERQRLLQEQADREDQSESLRAALRAARVTVYEAQQDSPEAAAAQQRLDALKQAREVRAAAIIATIRKAVEEWQGTGAECQNCFLVSQPETQECAYCRGRGFAPASFTPDYLATAHHRMRSSHKPDWSLARAPKLVRNPGNEPS